MDQMLGLEDALKIWVTLKMQNSEKHCLDNGLWQIRFLPSSLGLLGVPWLTIGPHAGGTVCMWSA